MDHPLMEQPGHDHYCPHCKETWTHYCPVRICECPYEDPCDSCIEKLNLEEEKMRFPEMSPEEYANVSERAKVILRYDCDKFLELHTSGNQPDAMMCILDLAVRYASSMLIPASESKKDYDDSVGVVVLAVAERFNHYYNRAQKLIN